MSIMFDTIQYNVLRVYSSPKSTTPLHLKEIGQSPSLMPETPRQENADEIM